MVVGWQTAEHMRTSLVVDALAMAIRHGHVRPGAVFHITRVAGVPGSHQPQRLDALHRAHAGVEDHVRHGKAMGLRNLPSKDWIVNQGWVLTCNIAADLTA